MSTYPDEMPRQRGNLPLEASSFVDRRREVADVRRLLGHERLVTFIGVGGVGKTRLARRIASSVHRSFTDGVWLVELASLQDGALLAQTVATTLGMADWSTQPVNALMNYVRDKRMLIVLDNCEHLLDACSALSTGLLGAAARVRIMATSRQPLRVGGEVIFDVHPLSVPMADQPTLRSIDESEAVRLFLNRAAETVPDFCATDEIRQVAAQICRRLDGIPLAIELAAVRLRSLSVQQILKRLDDQFRLLTLGSRAALPRQQTLRAAIDWSYELCSPAERTLWARMSVFAGSCDLHAVEYVCSGGEIATTDVCDLVAGLIDKSIVARELHGGDVRYRLLETIRQYGQMLLAGSGQEDDLRRRHRDHYRRIAMRAEQAHFGRDQMRWYARLRVEHANIRAALDYCLTDPREVRQVFRIVTANWPYWIACSLLGEGRRWLALALDQDHAPTPERAKALWVAARLALLQGDLDVALQLLRDCKVLAESIGDASADAHALEFLGVAALFQGDYGRAVSLQEEAVRRYREIGAEPPGICAVALYRTALAASAAGDGDRAVAFGEESLRICEEEDADLFRPLALWALGVEYFRRGDLRLAADYVAESLRIQDPAIRDLWNTAQCTELLAWIGAVRGQYQRAATIFGAAHTLWRSLGTSMPETPPFAEHHGNCESRLREALGDSEFAKFFAQGADLTLDQTVAYVTGTQRPEPDRRPTADPFSRLTPREREVARLVARGLSNRDIAAQLVISQRTAEGHVEHILSKLGFESRAQIATWVTEQAKPPG